MPLVQGLELSAQISHTGVSDTMTEANSAATTVV